VDWTFSSEEHRVSVMGGLVSVIERGSDYVFSLGFDMQPSQA
jgi:hypothetical protein